MPVEKMINIANHQGNANQNHNEMAPHTVRMAVTKKTSNNKCGCWWEYKLAQP